MYSTYDHSPADGGNDSIGVNNDGAARIDGGDGNDKLFHHAAGIVIGGNGDDLLEGESPLDPSPTALHCGPGTDSARADKVDAIDADCEIVTVVIQDPPGGHTIRGTRYDDDITAGDGDDHVFGLGGNERIQLDEGLDTVDAGAGDDLVFSFYGSDAGVPGDVDQVSCGAGRDRAVVDDVDVVSSDCEVVEVNIAPK